MTFGANSESGMEAAGGNWSSVFNARPMAFFHWWTSAIKRQSQLCLSNNRNQLIVSRARWPTNASNFLTSGQAICFHCTQWVVKVLAGYPIVQLSRRGTSLSHSCELELFLI